MSKSSTKQAEMQVDGLISGGGNGVNGVVGDVLSQGGDRREDTLHPDVKHAVDKFKAVFGFEYPEWCDASEKEKRATERFVSTASLKGVLGVDWKANGLPPECAEAVHRCGFIKAPSAMQQVRDDVGQPTSKTARGYYAPPVRTAERDAEIAAREAGVIREIVRSSLGFDLTVGKPAWLKHNATLDAWMDYRTEWELQRDGWKQNLPAEFFGEGIRFVTGRTESKGDTAKHPDGTQKLLKKPYMNGGKGSGVRLYGIDEISTPEHLAVEAKALTDELKFIGLHMHGTGFVCLDFDGVLRSDATVLDGGALVAAVEKELGADDFRARMIRAAVRGGHWVERSVSRTGVHVWVRAVSRVGTKSGKKPIEVYDHSFAKKRDSAIGFIALGDCITIKRGAGEDCEPADSLLDGQMLVDAVCLHYWADDMAKATRGSGEAVDGGVLGTRSSDGEGGVIRPQGGGGRKEKDTMPPVASAAGVGFSIQNPPAHLGGTGGTGGAGSGSGIPEVAAPSNGFNIRNRPAHLGGFAPKSFDEHRADGASTQQAMMREMQDAKLAHSPFAAPLLLGRALADAGLSGKEAVDVQRLIENVRAKGREAEKVLIGGATNAVNTDYMWYAIKTWALLEGEMGVPWLQAFEQEFPNTKDGTPLNWFHDDGTVDKNLVCLSLCQDLVRLMLSPADVENQTPTEIDSKRRHAVKVVDNAVRCSGAWEWYLEKRGGNGETAGQLLQSDVQKVSAARVDYLKKAESEKAAQKLAAQQADAGLMDDLQAKASAPWDGKALAAAKSNFSIPLEGANVWCHLSKGKYPKPLCTPENVGLLIMLYGCRARWNEMRHSMEYEGFGVDDGDHEAALNIVYMLAMRNGLNWKIDDVDRAFTAWAQGFKFHPAREWIGSKPWDGISRIEQLADSVTVAEGQRDNWLMYFMRWALGAVNALYSSTGGASKFMLVLQGKQSAGKTRWFRTLWGGQDICKDGVMLDVKNKDSVAETVSWFGVELGELEATYTTRQIAELKAFVTKLVDEWRSPYGRKVNKYPRRTAFIGTVNKDEPLADYTGNTRFATVTAEEILVDHGVDVQQFWAEVLHIWNTGTPDEKRHWLTKEEEAAMEQQNAQYTAKSTLHDYIEYLFDWSDAGKDAMRKAEAIGDKRHFMHLAQIYKLLDEQGVRVDGQAQKNDLTAALDRLGAIKSKNGVRVGGMLGRGFYLPPRSLRMEINGKSLNA